MKDQNTLFPETLLVSAEGGNTFTDSLKVAKHFHKAHDKVVRDIENLLIKLSDAGISLANFGGSDQADVLKIEQIVVDGSMLRFEQNTYQNARGKSYSMYVLNRDAFSLLVMGYTGVKEMRWKVEFIAQFNIMEKALSLQTQRYARALDIIRPNLRPVVEMSAKGCNRSTIGEALGKGVASVSYHRGQAKRLQITH